MSCQASHIPITDTPRPKPKPTVVVPAAGRGHVGVVVVAPTAALALPAAALALGPALGILVVLGREAVPLGGDVLCGVGVGNGVGVGGRSVGGRVGAILRYIIYHIPTKTR